MNKTMTHWIAGIATAASLGQSCSAPEVRQESCEAQADHLNATINTVHMLVIVAGQYLDMGRIGTSGTAEKAKEMQPKVKAQIQEMNKERELFKMECPETYQDQRGGLSGVSGIELRMASIQSEIKKLGAYATTD